MHFRCAHFSCLTGQAFSNSRRKSVSLVCQRRWTKPIIVASPKQRLEAGRQGQPPSRTLIRLGLARTRPWESSRRALARVFGSDGGRTTADCKAIGSATTSPIDCYHCGHARQRRSVRVFLRTSANPEFQFFGEPNYPSYGYMGEAPFFQVQRHDRRGQPAGHYHADSPRCALRVLGLARLRITGCTGRTSRDHSPEPGPMRSGWMDSKSATDRSCSR